MNHFGDLTSEEFKAYLGFTASNAPAKRGLSERSLDEIEEEAQRIIAERQIPASWDWRNSKDVTPVKDQGTCGDCYAFSSIATIESMHSIHTGSLVSLSEQFASKYSLLALRSC